MSDLIERLRDEPKSRETLNGLSPAATVAWHKTCLEAADHIEELEAESERLNKLVDRVYETANLHSLDCMWCAETADEIMQFSRPWEKDDE